MKPKSLLFLCFVLLSSCSPSDGGSYTLYRTSGFDANARIHMATFNAKDGHDYNMENCELARSLFQAQPGIITRFWCEKGNFRE